MDVRLLMLNGYLAMVCAGAPLPGQEWAKLSEPHGAVTSLCLHQGTMVMGSVGIWHSADNGTTWTRAATDPLPNFSAAAIASDGTMLYAARGTGRMVRSTNGGVDWTGANEGLPGNFNAFAVCAAASRILCGGNFDGGVYISEDQGLSWTESSEGLGSRNITTMGAQGDIVFAGSADGKVSRSLDGGLTWSDVSPADYSTTNYLSAIHFTGEAVWLGDLGGSSSPGILRSDDLGETWSPQMQGINETTHGFASDFADIGGYLFTGMGIGSVHGGLYKRVIDGGDWIPISSDQMLHSLPPVWPDTIHIQMTAMLANGSTLFAGMGGFGLYRSMDAGATWQQITSDAGNVAEERPALAEWNGTLYAGGTGGGVFISSDDGGFWHEFTANVTSFGITSLAHSETDLFSGHQVNGGVKRSGDGGQTWMPVNNGLGSLSIHQMAASGNTVFAGSFAEVYRSTDQGDSWVQTSLPVAELFGLYASGDLLFASHATAFFRSTDLGENWGQVTDGVPATWTARAFATMGTRLFAGGGPFVSVSTSTDDGLSWSDITGTVPIPVYALATAGDTVYAATATQVFYSIDVGENWTPISNDGIVNASFRALLVKGGYIYAGMANSGGANGAYRRAVPATTPINPTDKPRPGEFALVQNYPNPFNPATIVEFRLPKSDWVSLEIFDISGRHVKTLVERQMGAGMHRVQWDGRSDAGEAVASGVYFYRLKAGVFSQTRRMLLVR